MPAPRELWRDAREIACALRDIGLVPEAQVIAAAVEEASVGSELLMAVRFHLRGFVHDARVPPPLGRRMRELIAAIDAVIP